LLYSESDGSRLDNGSLEITTEAYITSISPLTGSVLGGTLVTITGENFSDVKTDNPVLVGDLLCEVESTSSTQIVCRIEKRDVTIVKEDEIIAQTPFNGEVDVFLKVAESADCRAESCTFVYIEPPNSITKVSVTFDFTLGTHIVSVEGEGFDQLSDVSASLDGFT